MKRDRHSPPAGPQKPRYFGVSQAFEMMKDKNFRGFRMKRSEPRAQAVSQFRGSLSRAGV
jgi:hypothetical protein